jgi:hypothetical protein
MCLAPEIKIEPLQVILVLLSLLMTSISSAADDSWEVRRTASGYPDLQGLWTNPSQTPFQRPAALGNKQTYSESEARQLEERARGLDAERSQPVDPNRSAPPIGGRIGAQADQDFEVMPIAVAKVNGEFRTSLIIDPPNGRLPYLEGASDWRDDWFAQGFGPFDGPEIRSGQERCLNSGGQLPLLFTFNATNAIDGDNPLRHIQIVQTENHIVILSEYFSAVRVIRLNSEHIENQGNKWLGDSIAWYEGDSLKIHTINFRPEQTNFFLKSSGKLEITETFSAVSDNEILFSYTLSDPDIYSSSVTAEIPLNRMAPGQKLYEYACHEGNYSLPSILHGARLEEAN